CPGVLKHVAAPAQRGFVVLGPLHTGCGATHLVLVVPCRDQCLRSRRLRIFPEALRGSASMTRTALGTLKGANRARACTRSCSGKVSTSVPSTGTTNAVTASIHR